MRARRSAAGIRVLAIPNCNSVSCGDITEPRFGWTECRMAVKQRIRWLAMHGTARGVSRVLARRGDPQGRLITDMEVRRNPGPFTEELRAMGPIVKCRLMYMTVDHKIGNDLLR